MAPFSILPFFQEIMSSGKFPKVNSLQFMAIAVVCYEVKLNEISYIILPWLKYVRDLGSKKFRKEETDNPKCSQN